MAENSIKADKLPENQQVKIWDMVGNKIHVIQKAHYESLKKGALKAIKGGTGRYPDWWRENYNLAEFGGQERRIYHPKTDKWVPFMTTSLFDEIKKRNPQDPNNKDDQGQPVEYWKNHLATTEEVVNAIETQLNPQEKINAQLKAQNDKLQKQLEELTAMIKKGGEFVAPKPDEVRSEKKQPKEVIPDPINLQPAEPTQEEVKDFGDKIDQMGEGDDADSEEAKPKKRTPKKLD